jgi:hypothetical protein
MAINGLNVSLSGIMVRQFCIDRAVERRLRAKLYEQQIKTLGEAGIDMGTASNDVKARAVENAKNCQQDADEMDFLASHIDPAETFILTKYDLQRLGIVK